MSAPFVEGSEDKTGNILCKIDPRTYQAQIDASQGELVVNEAKYKLAKTENERAQTLYKENPKAISLKSLDQHQAEADAAAAAACRLQRFMYVQLAAVATPQLAFRATITRDEACRKTYL